MPQAEQPGRDHPVCVEDRRLLAWLELELPKEGADADAEPRGELNGAEPQVPTRPSCGLDGSANLRFGIRPASRARRPPSTPARIAAAIRSGSCDLAIAVLASTASQPSSIASAASEAVPMPASSTTGTGLREQMSSIAAGFAIPIPEPISEPRGITAAQPTSASFWQVTGSSLQYGSTVKPLRTSSSAARTSCSTSGYKVSRSPISSSLTQDVSSASRANSAVRTASRTVAQPAVFGSNRQRPPSKSTKLSA